MKLYKYTSVDYVRSAIENGIFASELTSFNDPYEYEGIDYLEDYRACCLTGSPLKMLMWSYYGNHLECCIEFEVPDNVDIVKNVEYTKDYYQHRDMTGEEIRYNLYKKAHEWRHENEIRIAYYAPIADKKLWKVIGNNVFFKATVSKVMFGMRTDENADNVQRLLVFLKEMNHKNDANIQVVRCMLDNTRYALKENKQYQYTKHIV